VTGVHVVEAAEASLAAQGVTVRLGGRAVLQSVGLTFRRGRVSAIVGPNGAGKSTLLSCLAGLRRPDAGEVRLDGRPLAALPSRERARRIGYLPQVSEIAWPLDVHTFVRLGRTAHRGVFGEDPGDAEAVDRALRSTGMSEFAGRDVTTLSGGERARALIARAFAGEPAWVLADEPLTGLDLSHQIDAGELFRTAASEGLGVVISLHDLPFAARLADRIVLIAQGRVLADGAPAEALRPPMLAQAFGVDARWVEGEGGRLLDVLGRRRGGGDD
jgi:iron complex transport system ATP-binding protein